MAHFGIDYNLEDLKNPANEMELFSLVTEMCFFILREKKKVFKNMQGSFMYDKSVFCVMEK